MDNIFDNNINNINNTNNINDTNINDNIELSFEGSLWKCSFYLGVYKGLIEQYGYERLKNIKVAGTSSGTLIAMGIALGHKWEDLDRIYRLIAKYSKEYGNYGITSLYLDIYLDKMLKNDDDYKKLNGKLFIGVTKFFKKTHIVSEWTSNEDLKDTVRESTHIPFYIWRNIKTLTIDGCLSGGFVKISNNTLFISANEGSGHIYPSIKFTMADTFFTMQEPKHSLVVQNGYEQTKKYYTKSKGEIIKMDTKPMSDSLTFMIWTLYFGKTYWKPLCVLGIGSITVYAILKNKRIRN